MSLVTVARMGETLADLRDELAHASEEYAQRVAEEESLLRDEIRANPGKLVNRQPGSKMFEAAKKTEQARRRRDALATEVLQRETVITEETERVAAEHAATTGAKAVRDLAGAEEALQVKVTELLSQWEQYFTVLEAIDSDPATAPAITHPVYTDILVMLRDLFRDRPELRPREPFVRNLDKITSGSGMRFPSVTW